MGVPLEQVQQAILAGQAPQVAPFVPQVPQVAVPQVPQQQQVLQQRMQQLQQQGQALPPINFAENDPEFAESISGRVGGFMTVRANTLLLVAGLVAAATIGGYLQRAFPRVGKYGTLVAGVLIVVLGRKNTLVRSLGMGVFLAGVAEIVRQFDFVQSHFSEPDAGRAFAEQRTTYGGADGMVVTSPDRRTVI